MDLAVVSYLYLIILHEKMHFINTIGKCKIEVNKVNTIRCDSVKYILIGNTKQNYWLASIITDIFLFETNTFLDLN